MKFLVSLALKNLARYKRRTVLTFSILSVCITLFIVFSCMILGYQKDALENMVRFDTGHFKIRSLDYDPDEPYSQSNVIKAPDAVVEKLKKMTFVSAWTMRNPFQCELDNGRDKTPGITIGIDPENDCRVFLISNFIKSGRWPAPGEKNWALIGSGLADDLGLTEDMFVNVSFRTLGSGIDSVGFNIIGILEAPDPVVNGSTAFVDIDEATELLGSAGVVEISLLTENIQKVPEYQKTLEKELSGVSIWSYERIGQNVAAVATTKTKFFNVLLLFVFIIGMVGIINTMMMSVYEKTQEIGTLKALGMTDRQVVRLFAVEGLIIGVLGGLMGVIIGSLINWYFVAVGMDITALMGKEAMQQMAGLRMMNVLRSTWDIKTILGGFFLSAAGSFLASYYPARKTVAMQPAEALRTVQ